MPTGLRDWRIGLSSCGDSVIARNLDADEKSVVSFWWHCGACGKHGRGSGLATPLGVQNGKGFATLYGLKPEDTAYHVRLAFGAAHAYVQNSCSRICDPREVTTN
jgi:hypothetical protein